MKILVTNDDGILAQALWVLVRELSKIAQVVVVAPDREQSAIGTAVTLHQILRINRLNPPLAEVEAYSVDGTPSDCVLLALGRLIPDKVDMVISGINQGANLGDDVLISGTVSAALQGYLHGLPAVAISAAATDDHRLDNAAKLAALLARKIGTGALPNDILLNVNLPNIPLAEIRGAKVTYLASKSHSDTVTEENDGRRPCYRLVRQRVNRARDERADIGAIEQGKISITPLHTSLLNRPSPKINDSLCLDLLQELQAVSESQEG
ncbi:MAG: 5'/3'-nucleotidase SurE [Dehalococcoidia bacterium]|nr:MAG: 5'/3'-nucleotidase SurE [Dehalococcoidia bacterium]